MFDKKITLIQKGRIKDANRYSAFCHTKLYVRCDGLDADKNHICHKLSNLAMYDKL